MLLIWSLIKVFQRNFLSKIKNADNQYRTKNFSNLIGCFLTILLNTIVFKKKLGTLTVALRVAGAGIVFVCRKGLHHLLVG
jgi:hypothetical protein